MSANPNRSERAPVQAQQVQNQEVLTRYGLTSPRYTDSEVKILIEGEIQGRKLSVSNDGQQGTRGRSLEEVTPAIDRGEYGPAIDTLLASAQQKLNKASAAASNAEISEQRHRGRGAPDQWGIATGWFSDAQTELHAARSLVDRLSLHDQQQYLTRIAQILGSERMERVAERRSTYEIQMDPLELAQRKIEEVRRRETQKQQQTLKATEKTKHPETEKVSILKRVKENIIGINDPVTPFGKSKVGYAIGVGLRLGFNATPMKMVLAPTLIASNIIWEKWARSKVNKSRTPEEYQRRLEKYQKSRRLIRGFTAGATATSLVGVFRPELLEAIIESKPWRMSESWLRWKGSTVLGAPPSDFGLDAFGRPIEATTSGVDASAQVIIEPSQTIPLGREYLDTVVQGGAEQFDALVGGGGSEIVVRAGDSLERLFGGQGVLGEQLYDVDYMREVFYRNYDVFMRGNEEGVLAFEQYLNSGAGIDGARAKELFCDAVRFIFPGQQITIPKP